MDVSMAVQMRRLESSVDQAIDLRPALQSHVRRIDESERRPAEQGG